MDLSGSMQGAAGVAALLLITDHSALITRHSALAASNTPDKTFVGRISRGFDFLGYDFSPAGITGMSRRTVEKFAKRVAQLDEQGADAVGIGQYVRRWLRWTSAGLDGRVRWKETGYPVGCESVIGRFLPDLLSLRDTGDLWSRPSINHTTPTHDKAVCG